MYIYAFCMLHDLRSEYDGKILNSTIHEFRHESASTRFRSIKQEVIGKVRSRCYIVPIMSSETVRRSARRTTKQVSAYNVGDVIEVSRLPSLSPARSCVIIPLVRYGSAFARHSSNFIVV